MSGSVNKVILVGNCGRDPEIRFTQAGKKIANLRLATTESWKDRQTGEKRERTEWHTVVIFNDGLAGVVERFVKKGSKIYVEGQLRTRKWQDQSGQDRYSTEVVLENFNATMQLLDSRGGGGGRYGDEEHAGGDAPAGSGADPQGGAARPDDGMDLDDEIPF